MDTIRYPTPASLYIIDHLGDDDFTLVDVGCAYGLHGTWRAFGERLRAVGFDWNRQEIERLSAAENNPKVKYVFGWVGLAVDDPGQERLQSGAFWDRNATESLSFTRTLANRANRPVVTTQREQQQQSSPEAQLHAALAVPPTILLEDYLLGNGPTDVDFIKIDVDGPDLLILRSMENTLAMEGLLGITAEVNFFGSDHPDINTFHNTDKILRRAGFELFNLSVRRYSSASLPFPYVQDNPSLTTFGRPYQGDAFYMRDVANPLHHPRGTALPTSKIAKTAALFALHGLFDQAAQVAIIFREKLSSMMDVDHLLDLLALDIQGTEIRYPGYKNYMASFDEDDPYFYNRGGVLGG